MLKDALKALDDFKSKQKRYVEVRIYWKYIKYTIHWDKILMLNKLPLDKTKSAKNFSFVSSNSPQFYFCFSILIWAEAQGLSL